ncbi:homogentisate 1,2-dioxygenase [Skeletonema marinoi]|uniref:homogentisate 1,2-dioxygenase n=1 Tax=Skeletonema marinoi TaxID=267567 RepID=A0AAD9DF82_9STRA|nr:homogentisate 1,2-dioxygenase [Skeletonema marinoi]
MCVGSKSSCSKEELTYHHGFGNHFESEAYPGALPQGRNNPRIVPLGLYTEQLSGTAFTAPRNENRRTWLYRAQPSVSGTSNSFYACGGSDGTVSSSLPEIFGGADWSTDMKLDPNPMRWGATPLLRSGERVNFIQGVHTLLGSGDATCKSGIGIYVYAFNTNMSGSASGGEDLHMYNSDGDFLIVPQQEALWIQTEIGRLTVAPGEICVIPRGIVFTVNILNPENTAEDGSFARGYMMEIFRGHFMLPELGPIGSNGLANSRDFLHPTAHYESEDSQANKSCIIVNKFGQHLFQRSNPHSPYNVVAWHGNYLPYKYDLGRFCAVNSVTYDHPDPSIYTVLTAKGDENGTALADFVIFPPRVMATDQNTFRPPWFHRNVMTEFMGLIYGKYDAKKGKNGSGGFVPGGASLHSIMTPHGPDAASYDANVKNPCDEPTKFEGGLAFMFESSAMCKLSQYALNCEQRERDYASCWDGLDRAFPTRAE